MFIALFENFYSFYGLNLNLDRISPLSHVQTKMPTIFMQHGVLYNT